MGPIGPAGAAGPAGPQGPVGPQGPGGTATAHASGTIIVAGAKLPNRECEVVHEAAAGVRAGDFVILTGPDGELGWFATVGATGSNSISMTLCNPDNKNADPSGLVIHWAAIGA